MKRLLPFLLILSLLAFPAFADPLVLTEDLAEDIVEPYDEEDPSMGTFRYSYRYPQVDEEGEAGAGINQFYSDLVYELDFYIQIAQDSFEGSDSTTAITYEVTCNTDDYFSVLIRKEEDNPDSRRTTWTGNVFLRQGGNDGLTSTLPQYLGILNASETDEWLQNRQTNKTDSLIREMVWDLIGDDEAGIGFPDDLTEEKLSSIFFPEEDFYLDGDGEPVFYLQPADVFDDVPEGTELITFHIPLEDILDEL